jgi:hypothetical protein
MSCRCLLSTFVVAFALSAVIGCGGSDHLPLAPVTGTVMLDGQPLPEGRILFRPDAGRAGRGKVENGVIVQAATYGINDGLVLGRHKIAIQPIPEVERVAASTATGSSADGETKVPRPSYIQGLREQQAKAAEIPVKYQDVDGSGLTAEITEDGNELTLELTTE